MDKVSPYTSVSATRDILERYGLGAKKSLGQHFLVNDGIVKKILNLADINKSDTVLEVGPGIGTLTAALLGCAQCVIAVECDRDLCVVLRDTLASQNDALKLIEKDACDLCAEDLGGRTFSKFVANLPYQVGASIILDYFERFVSLQSATVMVQKEVADRIQACPGNKNYGAYTVKLALVTDVRGHFTVSRGCFYPPPHVDSAVVHLVRQHASDDEGNFLTSAQLRATRLMVDAAFATRRKTVMNSCKSYFAEHTDVTAPSDDELNDLFRRAHVDPAQRGETLALSDYIRLGKSYLDCTI